MRGGILPPMNTKEHVKHRVQARGSHCKERGLCKRSGWESPQVFPRIFLLFFP